MDAKTSIEGLEQLKKAFNLLPPRVAVKASSKAVREGAKEIQKRARANVAVDTGNLKRSITVKVLNRRRDALEVAALIGPGRGYFSKKKGTRTGDGFYGFFLEYGTKKMSAKPFMRPAYDEGKVAAQQIIVNTIGEAIEAEAAKLYGVR